MARPAVKGQETLDKANARKRAAENKEDTTPPVKTGNNETQALVTTPESGYEKPKTLPQLERIVESNVAKGAALWRIAADALMVIKDRKLWRNAINPHTEKPYGSFVAYAEGRFGFKKTYAYDLVKAAQRKPEALTEGEARAELTEERRAERGTKPLTIEMALDRMSKAWTAFEDKCGDYRDRTLDTGDAFAEAYDIVHAHMQETFSAFLTKHQPIPGQVVDPLADSQTPVSADAETSADEDQDGGINDEAEDQEAAQG